MRKSTTTKKNNYCIRTKKAKKFHKQEVKNLFKQNRLFFKKQKDILKTFIIHPEWF